MDRQQRKVLEQLLDSYERSPSIMTMRSMIISVRLMSRWKSFVMKDWLHCHIGKRVC